MKFRLAKSWSLILGLAVLIMSVSSTAGAEEYKEGKQYERVPGGQHLADPGTKDKIEVTEVFWYGCPHCYHMEPMVQAWLAQHGNEVHFVRVPAVLNENWRTHARAFFTEQLLGVVPQLHELLFEAIHKENKPLNNEQALEDFFAAHGVDRTKFKQTFNSFAVETEMRRAEQLVEAYGLTGVPAFVVNGKYWTDVRHAGGYPQTLEVVNYLINKERKRAP